MRSIDDVQIRFIVPAACVHYISYNLQYLNINYSVVKATLHPIIGISNKSPQTFVALSYEKLRRWLLGDLLVTSSVAKQLRVPLKH